MTLQQDLIEAVGMIWDHLHHLNLRVVADHKPYSLGTLGRFFELGPLTNQAVYNSVMNAGDAGTF